MSNERTRDDTAKKRERLEQIVELAIALLDSLDGDLELEETGDLEPFLGWTGSYDCATDDREADVSDEPHDDELDDDTEREPSLASSNGTDQREWSSGGYDEREDEHDGREPDADSEPTLGRTDHVDQTKADSALSSYLHCEDEPSLGWTVGGATLGTDDREEEISV